MMISSKFQAYVTKLVNKPFAYRKAPVSRFFLYNIVLYVINMRH